MTNPDRTTQTHDSGNPPDDTDLGALIPIGISAFGATAVRTADLRKVHACVGSGRQFSNWIKDRIVSYGFVEGVDFTCIDERGNPVSFSVNNSGDREVVAPREGVTLRIDYFGTISMAKELCMVENNDEGRRVRRYFLRMEQIAQDPMHALRDPNALRGLLPPPAGATIQKHPLRHHPIIDEQFIAGRAFGVAPFPWPAQYPEDRRHDRSGPRG